MPLFRERRCRPTLDLVVIGRGLPGAWLAGIDLHQEILRGRIDTQNEAAALGLPLRPEEVRGYPEAMERPAMLRPGFVDAAPLAGLAMLAPFAGRLIQRRHVVDLAAERACTAAAAWRRGRNYKSGIVHAPSRAGHGAKCAVGANKTIACRARQSSSTPAAQTLMEMRRAEHRPGASMSVQAIRRSACSAGCRSGR